MMATRKVMMTDKEMIADAKWAMNKAAGIPACAGCGEALHKTAINGLWRCPKCSKTWSDTEVQRMLKS